jgi:hypothetical protein
MSFELDRCSLVEPHSDADWSAYHDIRRRILFEKRGEYDVYDADRPDERAPGHYPQLLVRASLYLGVAGSTSRARRRTCGASRSTSPINGRA